MQKLRRRDGQALEIQEDNSSRTASSNEGLVWALKLGGRKAFVQRDPRYPAGWSDAVGQDDRWR